MLLTTFSALVELKPLGPLQVKVLTALLEVTESVFDCPAQIEPEFAGVTAQTKSQLVLPAPGLVAFD